MLLINYDVSLMWTRFDSCMIYNIWVAENVLSALTNIKIILLIYFSSSTKYNPKSLKKLKSGYNRIASCEKWLSEIVLKAHNEDFDDLIEPSR